MTIFFNDNLVGSGDLNGRVSTSGHTWTTYAGGAFSDPITNVIVLSAKGARTTGSASNREGHADSVSIPSGDFTIAADILSSSAANASWIVGIGTIVDPSNVFSVALMYLDGVYKVRVYSTWSAFTEVATFSGAPATTYRLTVRYESGLYRVLIDGVSVYGPASPINPPAGVPLVRIYRAATGEPEYGYLNNIEFDSLAPVVPPLFWMSLVNTKEAI